MAAARVELLDREALELDRDVARTQNLEVVRARVLSERAEER